MVVKQLSCDAQVVSFMNMKLIQALNITENPEVRKLLNAGQTKVCAAGGGCMQ
jgi:hypothetical protein